MVALVMVVEPQRSAASWIRGSERECGRRLMKKKNTQFRYGDFGIENCLNFQLFVIFS